MSSSKQKPTEMYISFIVLGVGEGSRDGLTQNRTLLQGTEFYMKNVHVAKSCLQYQLFSLIHQLPKVEILPPPLTQCEMKCIHSFIKFVVTTSIFLGVIKPTIRVNGKTGDSHLWVFLEMGQVTWNKKRVCCGQF